jgi:chloride channel 3/4/5
MFEVTYTKPDWHTTEIPLFILLGITMGIYGAVFCKLNIQWSKSFRQLSLIKRYPTLEVILVVLVTGTVGYYNRYTRISGTRLVEDLLSECSSGSGGKGKRGEWDGLCARGEDDILGLLGLLGWAIVIKALL